MRLSGSNNPYGALGRVKSTGKQDKAVGKKTPKIKSKAYKSGFMPKNKPRGILKDNY